MKRILEVFLLELKEIFTDTGILLTMFGGIIAYSVIYPLPYSEQVTRDVPIVVIDYDHSTKSRELIRMVDASPDTKVIGYVDSAAEAEVLIQTKKAQGLLVVPKHFRRDLLMKSPVTLSLGGDASYFMVYSNIATSILKSAGTLSAKIKVGRLTIEKGSMEMAKEQWRPASLNLQPVFNPESGYLNYIVPAVFILILQQTLVIVCGILCGTQNERARGGELGYWTKTEPIQLLLCRCSIFIGVYMCFSLYYFGFALDIYGINRIARAYDILRLLLPFLFAVVCMGVAVGQLYKHPEVATQVVLFSSMPLLFSSGFVWPISDIPQFMVVFSQFFPSTAAIQGMLQLNQMGATFDQVEHFQLQLMIQAAGYGLIAIMLMGHKQQRLHQKTAQ